MAARCAVGGSKCVLRAFAGVRHSSGLPATDLRLFRVPDLRYLLRFAGLPASGGRGDLERRLEDNAELELTAEAQEKVARNFELELQSALSKVPRSQRPILLAHAATALEGLTNSSEEGETHGHGRLSAFVDSLITEQAAAATSLSAASALACVAARLRQRALEIQAGPGAGAPAASTLQSAVSGAAPWRAANGVAGGIRLPSAGILADMQNIGSELDDKAAAQSSEADAAEARDDDGIRERRRAAILDLNFRLLGVGGLDVHTQQRLRRALLSRGLDDDLRLRLGMRHQRGFLLFGPPGCGKTLIARCLSNILCATTVQYVTAADINAKWFGESDQKMKLLFEPARTSREKGRTSDLHLVVMDEIDALAATRSGGDARNHESALNVLLASMDGFEENDQTVVIGLTNRRDKVDPALLRPGRLGVQIEVAAPDAEGRLDILQLHCAALARAELLAADVCLLELSRRTAGFSGAELRQLVDGATAFALLSAPEEQLRSGGVSVGLVGSTAMKSALQEILSSRNE